MGNFVAGVLLTLFFGFLANRLGYLSVHDKAEKEQPEGTGSGGGGSSDPRENIHHK